MKATPEMTVAEALACADYSWPKNMQGEPQARIDMLTAHFGNAPLATIGLAQIEAYQTERRTVRVSRRINEECAALLAVLTSAKLLTTDIEDLYTPFEGVLDISPIYSGEHGINELERLMAIEPLKQSHSMILDCCWVILGTAVMWEELRLMRREHVDLDGKTITVPAYRCVPERTMPIMVCAELPDPLAALQRLLDSAASLGATQPQDYLLSFVNNKTIRAYPLKKLWNALRETAKSGDLWMHENLRYSLRAWALLRWPEIAPTAGPGPDEYCGGMAEMMADPNDGWRDYCPKPGRVKARIPNTYDRNDDANVFFDDATIKKAATWNAMHMAPLEAARAKASQANTPQPVFQSARTAPAENPVVAPETFAPKEKPATHTLPAAGKLYGTAKEVNAAIGQGMVSVKSLIKRLKKAGIAPEVILDIISGDE